MTSYILSRQPKFIGEKRAKHEVRTLYEGVGLTAAEPAAVHVRELHDMGLPWRSMARDAGMAERYILRLKNNEYLTIKTRYATQLLALTHHPNERQDQVIAIGGVRRLAALRVLRWSSAELARRSRGLTERRVSQLVNRPQTMMPWETWVDIRDLYETLSAAPGDCDLSRQWPLRSQSFAPLDWEDLDIDDPRVKPEPAPKLTVAERVAEQLAEVQHWTARGLTALEIAERMGITQRSVERHRSRLAALELEG